MQFHMSGPGLTADDQLGMQEIWSLVSVPEPGIYNSDLLSFGGNQLPHIEQLLVPDELKQHLIHPCKLQCKHACFKGENHRKTIENNQK
jgi:hypothetical protein